MFNYIINKQLIAKNNLLYIYIYFFKKKKEKEKEKRK